MNIKTLSEKTGDAFTKKNSVRLLLSGIIFVTISIFYAYVASSYFGIAINPLQNRSNYPESFTAHLIGVSADKIIITMLTFFWILLSFKQKRTNLLFLMSFGIAIMGSWLMKSFDLISLITIPLVVSFLIINRISPQKFLKFSSIHMVYLFLIIGTLGALFSMILSFQTILIPNQPLKGVHDYGYDIFLLFSDLSPFLLFFLIAYSPFKLSIKKLTKASSGLLGHSSSITSKKILLILSVVISLMLVLVPHQSTINQSGLLIGSDSADYVDMVNNLYHASNASEFVHQAFVTDHGGDRPFSLIIFAGLGKIMPVNLVYIIDHLPLFLAPALVLSTYLLTKEIANEKIAIFAAFLTAVSYQSLIGIYSGIYSNWLSLVFGYVAFTFIFRYLKKPNKTSLILFGAFLISALFTHVYTWTILSLVAGVFLLLLLKTNRFQKRNIVLLLLVILVSVAVDVIRTEVTGSIGGIEQDITISSEKAGPQQVLLIWKNLEDTTYLYSGGQFSNFILPALAIFWILYSKYREISSVFLLSFLAVVIIPLLFGNVVLQTRVLYDIPLQIPASISIVYAQQRLNNRLVIPFICTWLFATAIRFASNFAPS